jgi:hypothetical protein
VEQDMTGQGRAGHGNTLLASCEWPVRGRVTVMEIIILYFTILSIPLRTQAGQRYPKNRM